MRKNITTRKKTSRNYINNAKMYEELVNYKNSVKNAKESNEKEPPIPDYLAECFMQLAKRYGNNPNFSMYSYRDEMEADAIVNMIRYIHNFDETRYDNPFAYFTQYAHNAFIRRIKEEHKQNDIKLLNGVRTGIMDELESSGKVNQKKNDILYENLKKTDERKKVKRQIKVLPKKKASCNVTIETFINVEKQYDEK